jgi:alkylated DNA repair dioxygenase AlkB
MEVLLQKVKPVLEKETGVELYETYSYARIYKNGDILSRHKDRFSCEISATMFLGGDPWPIYLDPTEGYDNEGVRVDLNPGDILIYRGAELEHWRDPFAGTNCMQVFLHYNNKATENAKKNKYDGRDFLGLPTNFKKVQ